MYQSRCIMISVLLKAPVKINLNPYLYLDVSGTDDDDHGHMWHIPMKVKREHKPAVWEAVSGCALSFAELVLERFPGVAPWESVVPVVAANSSDTEDSEESGESENGNEGKKDLGEKNLGKNVGVAMAGNFGIPFGEVTQEKAQDKAQKGPRELAEGKYHCPLLEAYYGLRVAKRENYRTFDPALNYLEDNPALLAIADRCENIAQRVFYY
jgi:hypothetical protein